jgi:hypothetical protein
MVQDCIAEDFDNVVHHKDRIQEELDRHAIVPQEYRGSTTTGSKHGNRTINITDIRNTGRRREGYSSYNTVVKNNIPHHTQYVYAWTRSWGRHP